MKDMKKGIQHLREHQDYPATKKDLVESCNKLSDFSPEDKAWFESHLTERTYNSADEVVEAMGWSMPKTQVM